MNWKEASATPVVRAYEREVGSVVIRKTGEDSRLRELRLKCTIGGTGMGVVVIASGDEEADKLASMLNRLAELAKDMQP